MSESEEVTDAQRISALEAKVADLETQLAAEKEAHQKLLAIRRNWNRRKVNKAVASVKRQLRASA